MTSASTRDAPVGETGSAGSRATCAERAVTSAEASGDRLLYAPTPNTAIAHSNVASMTIVILRDAAFPISRSDLLVDLKYGFIIVTSLSEFSDQAANFSASCSVS
jgi:hypothetical protein